LRAPRQNAIVKRNAAGEPKSALSSLVQLVAISDLCDAADCGLGRQAELFADLIVTEMVQVVLFEQLGLPCPPAYEFTCSVRGLQGTLKGVGLFGRGQELKLGEQFHGLEFSTNVLFRQVSVKPLRHWDKVVCII
jgi:hypothetical protein